MKEVNSFTEILNFVSPVKNKLLLAITLSLGSVITGIISLILFAFIIYQVKNFPSVWPWNLITILLVSTLASCLMRTLSFNQSHYAAFCLETTLRVRITNHLSKIPMGYINNKGSAELAKILHDDVKSLHIFIADSFPLYARAYVSPIITFIIVFFLDWRLALTTLAIVIFGFSITSLSRRNHNRMAKLYYEAKERVNSSLVEFIQAMPVIRTFEYDGDNFSRYKAALEKYLKLLTLWYKETGLGMRLSMLILSSTSSLIAILWLGSWFIWHNSLSFQNWIAILLIGIGMAEAFIPLMALKPLIDKTKLSISSIQEVLSIPILSEPNPERALVPLNSSICFKNVYVRHKEQKYNVLSNINFIIKPNTITAIVGSSGAGKSTLLNLISRYQDTFSGQVMIGEVDVKDMTIEVLMKQISFVSQNTFIFSGTIADNISLGIKNVSKMAIIKAAKIAQIHDFISTLPNGYDTLTGERGVFISGGQAQRLSIARAIIQDKPILILDEATSQIDPENEINLMESLSQILCKKTVLIVTHRLNTIQNIDEILVFDKGELVSKGSHNSLIYSSKIYMKLWNYYEQSLKWSL